MRPRVEAEKALSQGPLGQKGAVWTPRLRLFESESGIGIPILLQDDHLAEGRYVSDVTKQ